MTTMVGRLGRAFRSTRQVRRRGPLGFVFWRLKVGFGSHVATITNHLVAPCDVGPTARASRFVFSHTQT